MKISAESTLLTVQFLTPCINLWFVTIIVKSSLEIFIENYLKIKKWRLAVDFKMTPDSDGFANNILKVNVCGT